MLRLDPLHKVKKKSPNSIICVKLMKITQKPALRVHPRAGRHILEISIV